MNTTPHNEIPIATKPTRFYRIENKAGHGPYHSNSLFLSGMDFAKYSDAQGLHPSPLQDSALWQGLKTKQNCGPNGFPNVIPYIFGFSSIEQLRAWFFSDEVLAYLHAQGFSLWESCAECIVGNSQAIALKTEYDLAERREIALDTLLAK